MSLDGYIAGPKGEADWIIMDPEIDFRAIFAQFDTLLIGRKTFDAMRKMHGGAGGGMGMQSYVFSRTLKPKDVKGATLVSDDAKELLTELKKKPGKDIWLWGGGALFASLNELGLVDTVEVAVIPVVLGGGIPLVPATGSKAKLKLTSNKVYKKTGIVSLEYAITGSK